MADATRSSPARGRRAVLAVHVLADPAATPAGIRHGRGGGALLPWSAVHTAFAAEVGEPEGVRTVVFDLVVEAAGELRVLRLDAEPGSPAMELARAIARGVSRGRKLPWIESLAVDGTPARWYPDLESFEEARDALLASRP
jgi:hypothetical protein